MKRLFPAPVVTAALTLALAAPAGANDSEAEWAVGGLALKQNDAISMDQEDLYISASEIRVDYTYTNHADTPQTVLVSFPIPPLPGAEPGWIEYGAYPDWENLNFTTRVDGKPVEWKVAERAVIDGRDVTTAVAAAGHPLRWYQDYEWIDATSQISGDQAQAMIASGLFLPATEDWGGSLMPAWQVQYHVTREQTFPARASVKVAHRYTPIIGGSVGGMLDVIDSGEYPEPKAYYEGRYCIDQSFINGVKKRQRDAASRAGNGYHGHGETWIGYILSSGANWRGPIKDFRLVVDKEKPDNLVSFCMDGVTKISPTQFEVRKKNYEPDHDLNVLVVQWHDPDK